MSKDFDENLDDEMLEEYDFSDGIRGKHAQKMENGYTVVITHPDGTVTRETILPSENVVVIAEDLIQYFPDSDSVNRALRTLVSLFPKQD